MMNNPKPQRIKLSKQELKQRKQARNAQYYQQHGQKQRQTAYKDQVHQLLRTLDLNQLTTGKVRTMLMERGLYNEDVERTLSRRVYWERRRLNQQQKNQEEQQQENELAAADLNENDDEEQKEPNLQIQIQIDNQLENINVHQSQQSSQENVEVAQLEHANKRTMKAKSKLKCKHKRLKRLDQNIHQAESSFEQSYRSMQQIDQIDTGMAPSVSTMSNLDYTQQQQKHKQQSKKIGIESQPKEIFLYQKQSSEKHTFLFNRDEEILKDIYKVVRQYDIWDHTQIVPLMDRNKVDTRKSRQKFQEQMNPSLRKEVEASNSVDQNATYGEITMHALDKIFTYLQSITIDNKELRHLDIKDKSSYDLSKDSLFLDIGSGLGKPCFHAAYATGCQSHGIEVAVTRYQASEKALRKLTNNRNINHDGWCSRVSFERTNAAEMGVFKSKEGKHYTHIYSYNKLMSEDHHRGIMRVLNNTDFKVFVSSKKEEQLRQYGLVNVKSVHVTESMHTTGGQSFKFYIMIKMKDNEPIRYIEKPNRSQMINQLSTANQVLEGFKTNHYEYSKYLSPNREKLQQTPEQIKPQQRHTMATPSKNTSNKKVEQTSFSRTVSEEPSLLIGNVEESNVCKEQVTIDDMGAVSQQDGIIAAKSPQTMNQLKSRPTHEIDTMQPSSKQTHLKPLRQHSLDQYMIRKHHEMIKRVHCNQANALPFVTNANLNTEEIVEREFNCKVISFISRGHDGKVYKVQDLKTNVFYAVKVCKLNERVQNEEKMLRLLDQKLTVCGVYILKVLKQYCNFSCLYLKMDYYPLTLSDMLTSRLWSMSTIRLITIYITRGLDACHTHGIAHCDIKPSNILISKAMNPVLADFSMSYKQGDKQLEYRGTKGYMAPEVALHAIDPSKIDYKKADCWSLGVLIYVMLCNKLPFPYEKDSEPNYEQPLDLSKIVKLRKQLKVDEKVLNDACELVQQLLVIDPSKRLTTAKILKSPWLNEYRESLSYFNTANIISRVKDHEQNHFNKLIEKVQEQHNQAPIITKQ